MKKNIEDFINCKSIALIGASRTGTKFGNSAYKELVQRGYDVKLMHPSADQIEGQPTYPTLTALSGMVDGVIVSVKPEQSIEVLRQAKAAGINNVWLQQGAESAEVIKLGQELGLNLVVKKCILMYAPQVTSIHKFHRTIAKIFGQY